MERVPVRSNHLSTVMPARVAGIHVFLPCSKRDVDGRDKPGHDSREVVQHDWNPLRFLALVYTALP
jgi:hypothetical protein